MSKKLLSNALFTLALLSALASPALAQYANQPSIYYEIHRSSQREDDQASAVVFLFFVGFISGGLVLLKHKRLNAEAGGVQRPIGGLPSEPISFASEVGANYSQLANLLSQAKWKEADLETKRLMILVGNHGKHEREKEFPLDREKAQNFPLTDLRTINQLWTKYSQGIFGFSIQKRIYNQVEKDYTKFELKVGWGWSVAVVKVGEPQKRSLPEGHFPTHEFTWSMDGGDAISYLFAKEGL